MFFDERSPADVVAAIAGLIFASRPV